MAAAMHVPVEIYLRSSYEPDAEFVDGEVEERPAGGYDHAAWQKAILTWFLQHEEGWNVNSLPELRIRVSETRYRVPDVTVLDARHPVEQIITQPPLAVFEILSPEDTFARLRRKLDDYVTMGIPNIWVIDPTDGATLKYEGSSGSSGNLHTAGMFEVTDHGICFSMDEIRRLLRR